MPDFCEQEIEANIVTVSFQVSKVQKGKCQIDAIMPDHSGKRFLCLVRSHVESGFKRFKSHSQGELSAEGTSEASPQAAWFKKAFWPQSFRRRFLSFR